MNNFDYRKYVYNNPLLMELEDDGPEEKAFDAEFDALGSQLAGAVKGELGDKAKKIDEVAGVVGIVGYILLSNTVANLLAKFAKKQAKKYNWGKGEEAADNLYKWTHDNEKAFQAPIRRVVKLFTKDEKRIEQVTKALYAILILLMAGQSGGDAASYLKKASWFKGGLAALKTAVKGKEVHALFSDVVSGI